MFFFFRQVRRRLLLSKKTRKYLFYAIGEITLVMIGILIAFQIDRTQQYHNQELKTRKLLEGVIDNLRQDIFEAGYHQQYWNEQYKAVERYFRVISKENDTLLPYQDRLIEANFIFGLSEVGFTNLMQNRSEILVEETKLFSSLNVLYTDYSKIFEVIEGDLEQIKREAWHYLIKNNPNYSTDRSFENCISPSENFLYKDWKHRNFMKAYLQVIGRYRWEFSSFRQKAMHNYMLIHNYLYPGEKLPDFFPKNRKRLSYADLEEYVGTYTYLEDSTKVEIKIAYPYLYQTGNMDISFLFYNVGEDSWKMFAYSQDTTYFHRHNGKVYSFIDGPFVMIKD